MSLIKCNGCGNQVSLKANACPKCGEPSPSPKELRERTKKSILSWRVIIGSCFVLFIGNAIFAVNFPNNLLIGIEQIKLLIGIDKKPNLKRYVHSRVNVRKGPGTDFEIVSRLKQGELVEVADSKDKWVEVYKDNQRLGYIHASLLAKNPPKRNVNVNVNVNEQLLLLNTKSWGDFRKAKKVKLTEPKKRIFFIWSPILQYTRNTLYPRMGTWAKSPDAYIQKMHGHGEMMVTYDEIWTWENDSAFTQTEKGQYKGKLDIYKIYWLKGKIQAHIIAKVYESNPVTDATLSPPTHKIWQIFDRKQVFKKL